MKKTDLLTMISDYGCAMFDAGAHTFQPDMRDRFANQASQFIAAIKETLLTRFDIFYTCCECRDCVIVHRKSICKIMPGHEWEWPLEGIPEWCPLFQKNRATKKP
jgi:hypothetical protein